jgi:hypothetical protein
MMPKLRQLRDRADELGIELALQVDGGITDDTLPIAAAAASEADERDCIRCAAPAPSSRAPQKSRAAGVFRNCRAPRRSSRRAASEPGGPVPRAQAIANRVGVGICTVLASYAAVAVVPRRAEIGAHIAAAGLLSLYSPFQAGLAAALGATVAAGDLLSLYGANSVTLQSEGALAARHRTGAAVDAALSLYGAGQFELVANGAGTLSATPPCGPQSSRAVNLTP